MMLINEEEFKKCLIEANAASVLINGGSKHLIERWRKFVTEVERGYGGNENEYLNDLDTRYFIAISQLDTLPEVIELDKRFQNLLIHKDVKVWSSYKEVGDWWNYGYPKNLPTNLLDYFGAKQ